VPQASRRLDRAAADSPQRRLFSAWWLRHRRGLRSTLARPPIRGFAFIGRGGPLLLLLPFKPTLFGRAGKSGRPAPLEPSLEVYRDIAHNLTKAPGLLSPRGGGYQRARALKGPFNDVSRNQRWRTMSRRRSAGGILPKHGTSCACRSQRRRIPWATSLGDVARDQPSNGLKPNTPTGLLYWPSRA
jgi:hypothetical protein